MRMEPISETLGILDLLDLMGFDKARPAKMARHQRSSRYDMDQLMHSGWFEAYQSFQRKPVFDRCEQVVSFVGAGGTRARFVGVFQVLGRRPARQGLLPRGCPYKEWKKSSFYYDLERDHAFADLEQRVVIEWGRSARSWHQRLRNKRVIEVLPQGQVRPPFRDYLEFSLTHAELAAVFARPEAHREWRARLSAVAGVYLVVASTTGAQYVGSAHGEKGIWGRWLQYARSGHGGNALLKELVSRDPDYPDAFVFSILQVLPKTLTHNEVLEWEARYKVKFGRRAVSLNLN